MASAPESAGIRVLSWTINGLKAKLKEEERRTALLEIFDKYNIVLLQETHIDEKHWEKRGKIFSDKYDIVILKDQAPRETDDNQEKRGGGRRGGGGGGGRRGGGGEKKRSTLYMTYFSSSKRGVAILVKKPHTLLKSFSEGGDYAWVHVEIDKQKYTFVSVYYHPDAHKQIRNLMSEISKGSEAFKGRLVIGGDFNTTLDPELDATSNISAHAARRKTVNDFLIEANLSDVWREMHPEDPEKHTEYKYTRKHHNGTESRLDYIFMLKDEVKYVKRCKIHNDIALSDHFPVSLTLNYRDSEQPIEERLEKLTINTSAD